MKEQTGLPRNKAAGLPKGECGAAKAREYGVSKPNAVQGYEKKAMPRGKPNKIPTDND